MPANRRCANRLYKTRQSANKRIVIAVYPTLPQVPMFDSMPVFALPLVVLLAYAGWRMGAGRVQSWRDFLGSFAHAAAGIGFALRSERNMRVHLLVAGLVLIAGLWLQIDLTGFRWLVLAMALVMIAELLNTGIEQACNAITREKRPEIRAAKDVAAGAVLIASIAAALIGGSVLGPPLWQNLAPMLFETWAPL